MVAFASLLPSSPRLRSAGPPPALEVREVRAWPVGECHRGRLTGTDPRVRTRWAGRVAGGPCGDLRCGCGPRYDSLRSRWKATRWEDRGATGVARPSAEPHIRSRPKGTAPGIVRSGADASIGTDARSRVKYARQAPAEAQDTAHGRPSDRSPGRRPAAGVRAAGPVRRPAEPHRDPRWGSGSRRLLSIDEVVTVL